VSPIFRHGRLRLYLLKLLDEAPRHGYEVIRLLQDRFMGVYSPSPGTIYPRLARLEDDGLVTHDEVEGRKVYRITEKGREEIRARLDDLAELEDELTESVRDIAREVSEDVRDTVRSLREEITWAARDVRRDGRGPRDGRPGPGERDAEPGRAGSTGGAGETSDAEALSAAAGGGGASSGGASSGDSSEGGASQGETAADDAQRIRDEARQARDDIRDAFRSHRSGGHKGGARTGGARPGARAGSGRPGSGRPDWAGFAGRAGLPAGLDRLASDFARDLSHVAGHAGDLGEGALGDLKNILADALTRIRDEVFAPGSDGADAAEARADAEAAAAAKPGADAAAEAGADVWGAAAPDGAAVPDEAAADGTAAKADHETPAGGAGFEAANAAEPGGGGSADGRRGPAV
jgi:DNA-binding PadR family transcriptional regulator